MVNRITNYLKTSIEELRKVAWPTKSEITRNTILVIVVGIGVALFLGGVDFLLQLVVSRIF